MSSLPESEFVQSLVLSGAQPEDVFAKTAAWGHRYDPHPVWAVLGRLPAQEDVPLLVSWYQQILHESPLPSEIRTLRFGLVTPVVRSGATFALECDGTVNNAWEKDFPPDYFPQRGLAPWLHSGVLDALYEACTTPVGDMGALGSTGEYLMGLAYASVAVHAMSELWPELVVGCPQRDVVLGWSSGDHISVGRATSQGWNLFPVMAPP